MARRTYTIRQEDVGLALIKLTCPTCGHPDIWLLGDAIGRVQQCDVGKRAYKDSSGTIQVENQEQLEARLKMCADCDLPDKLTLRNRQLRDLRRSTRKH